MDELEANITATCPQSFAGVTGNLFAKAITAVIATHCAFFNDYSWPKDRSEDVLRKFPDTFVSDFIIVGAGTAGSLVAGRLAKLYPSLTVLLIEAGDDPGLDSEIPAFLFLGQNTSIDWNYHTISDGNSCLGFKNNSCIWSKGKGLGGSSAINAMLYVRGHPIDYDRWEQAGNNDWGYENLRKYFEKIEDDYDLLDYKYHENKWYNILEKAWNKLGLAPHEKESEETLVGTRISKILTSNGKRLNTAKLYLDKSPNLHVMKNTVVQRITIDTKYKISTGVQIYHASGVVMELKATKEIILSAGSIATPQILMLSGIGPKKHLKEVDIECIHDLSVGQNLQDHVLLPLFLKTNLSTHLTSNTIISFFIHYILSRTGPFNNIGVTDFMAFIDTANLNYPDVQFHHTYFSTNYNFVLKPYLKGLGYREEIIESILKLNENSDMLGIYPTLLNPLSKGEILLVDKNPFSPPLIKTKYFNHPADIETLLRGIEVVYKLQNTTNFRLLGAEIARLDIPECVKMQNPVHYWECYIRHMATTVYHPVGTAKMGSASDKTAVVDNNLLVHGVKNLRVVDASIMPVIPRANTMAATLAIAEKAISIIQKHYDYEPKDEF